MNVIVLNADNTYIGSITWQQAVVLLHKGKVEIVKATDRVVRNITREYEYIVPRIVRLISFVKQVYKKSNVGYSKRGVFLRDKYKCQYCNVTMEKKRCTVDHVTPKAHGGKSDWENCVCSCTRCNNLKGDIPLGRGDSLTVTDAQGVTHHIKLRKRPQRPSVSDFLRMKAMNIVLDDID
jgi:5-methylcytosine-specific restriction endonuclease McrA